MSCATATDTCATLLILFLAILPFLSLAQNKSFKHSLILMGDRFEITAVHPHETLCKKSVEAAIAEIARIDSLISEWKPASETSMINDNAGIQPVKVSPELMDLIARSIKVSELTDGAFDISFAPMNNLWKFDRLEHEMPPADSVKKFVQKVGWQKIILDKENQTVFLKETGMKIGFGGIGQGYAANKAKDVMVKMGIENGVVNASGDITAWGKRDDGKDWEVGIGNPDNPGKHIAWLNANDIAITTSGNYEKFFTSNGTRYGHVIDPRTGYPVAGLKSVTVICADTELADALDTAIFVLGAKDGLELVEQLNGVECVIITDKDEIITSGNVQLNYYSTGGK